VLASKFDSVTELLVWDVRNWKVVRSLEGNLDPVRAVAISPDGRLLASGGGNQMETRGELSLWDLASGRRMGTLVGHKDVVWSVAFSPDGQTLASGSSDKKIMIWDISNYRTLFKKSPGAEKPFP
jgi:WD40 repeat protein